MSGDTTEAQKLAAIFRDLGEGLLDDMLDMALGGGGRRRSSTEYTPYGATKRILDRAMEHIQSVSYQVSVRWVFYRLLQEGLYNKKSDYAKFIALTSRARHAWYNGWDPTTLADETRAMVVAKVNGDPPDIGIESAIEHGVKLAEEEREDYREQFENYRYRHAFDIDTNYYQERFCLIMFEARAMGQQFRTYTDGLTLCPFGGQPSIPYKWAIAKYIEDRCAHYEKPAVVLYFGDLDDAGESIFRAGKTDIGAWCSAPIHFVRCGLTQEQVERYGIPENFEHPGYQWEALTDAQAPEIIESSLAEFYDMDAAERAEEESARIRIEVTQAVNEKLGA